jgi:hypothetical protein
MAFLSFIEMFNECYESRALPVFVLWVVSTYRFPPLPPQTRPDELQEVIIIAINKREMFFII